MKTNTSEDVALLVAARPEGYSHVDEGRSTHIAPDYEIHMLEIWDRSSLMPFYDWDPPRDTEGSPVGPRWHEHYLAVLTRDIESGRLTADEGERLIEFLDITGT